MGAPSELVVLTREQVEVLCALAEGKAPAGQLDHAQLIAHVRLIATTQTLQPAGWRNGPRTYNTKLQAAQNGEQYMTPFYEFNLDTPQVHQ